MPGSYLSEFLVKLTILLKTALLTRFSVILQIVTQVLGASA